MKSKSKTDLISQIQKIDLLEFTSRQIQKKSLPSSKKSELTKFIAEASSYIDDERDVLLIAIKVR